MELETDQEGFNEISRILLAMEKGNRQASDQLLPLVYEELRKLAAQKLAQEKEGQTLEATALVHEAYLRLTTKSASDQPSQPSQAQLQWDSRGHFFAAAAEAMRRILVENARRKRRLKHGGGLQRVGLDDHDVAVESPSEDIVELNDALNLFAQQDPFAAKIVEMHFFGGLSIEDVAEALGISRATAYRQWSFARAWLRCAMDEKHPE